MKFKIYQIKKELVSTGTYLFMSYSYAKDHWFDIRDYEVVYEGEVEPGRYIEDTLENIFYNFNAKKPKDFNGHSLSISDIIELNSEFFYTEPVGFKSLGYDLL